MYRFMNVLFISLTKQSSGKSSVLESIVGRDFLPRGSGEEFSISVFYKLHRFFQLVFIA